MAARAPLHEQLLAVDEVVAVVLELAARQGDDGEARHEQRPDPSSSHGAACYLPVLADEVGSVPAWRRDPGGPAECQPLDQGRGRSSRRPSAAPITVRATPSQE